MASPSHPSRHPPGQLARFALHSGSPNREQDLILVSSGAETPADPLQAQEHLRHLWDNVSIVHAAEGACHRILVGHGVLYGLGQIREMHLLTWGPSYLRKDLPVGSGKEGLVSLSVGVDRLPSEILRL